MEVRILDHPHLSLQDTARRGLEAGEMVEKCSCGVAIVWYFALSPIVHIFSLLTDFPHFFTGESLPFRGVYEYFWPFHWNILRESKTVTLFKNHIAKKNSKLIVIGNSQPESSRVHCTNKVKWSCEKWDTYVEGLLAQVTEESLSSPLPLFRKHL